MNFELKKNGFSLVEVLVALSILGGISLLVMQLGKNSSTMEAQATSKSDYRDLKNEVDFIIDDEKECTASLAGTTFFGSTIQNTPVSVELWLADHTGARSRKRFSATDSDFNQVGKITITSINLTFPDYTSAANFGPGPGTSKGSIAILGFGTVMGKTQNFRKINKSISVEFTTDASGQSTIYTCSSSSESTLETLGIYKTACTWIAPSTISCAPPACAGGDIDKAVGCEKTFELWGGPSGYHGGNCHRVCATELPSPMFLYYQQCPTGGIVAATCPPNACNSGEIDKGVMCTNTGSSLGGPSGTFWGTCRRHCFADSPF